MKKLKVMAAVVAAAAIFGASALADERIAGESLDSGLGELSATYTASEYNIPGWVSGESMDSGLGELDQSYTGDEFMPARQDLVVRDSFEGADNFRCGTCS